MWFGVYTGAGVSCTLSGHCVGMGKLRPAIRTETNIGVTGIGVVGIGVMLND